MDILIFADGVSIHRSLLDGSQHHILPLNHIQKAKFVEFDPQSKQIYWSDVQTREIWRTDMCGEGRREVMHLLDVCNNAKASRCMLNKYHNI